MKVAVADEQLMLRSAQNIGTDKKRFIIWNYMCGIREEVLFAFDFNDRLVKAMRWPFDHQTCLQPKAKELFDAIDHVDDIKYLVWLNVEDWYEPRYDENVETEIDDSGFEVEPDPIGYYPKRMLESYIKVTVYRRPSKTWDGIVQLSSVDQHMFLEASVVRNRIALGDVSLLDVEKQISEAIQGFLTGIYDRLCESALKQCDSKNFMAKFGTYEVSVTHGPDEAVYVNVIGANVGEHPYQVASGMAQVQSTNVLAFCFNANNKLVSSKDYSGTLPNILKLLKYLEVLWEQAPETFEFADLLVL